MNIRELNGFIGEEKRRVYQNLESGTVGREQAVGSLNTLYQLAAVMSDPIAMRDLSVMISRVRSGEERFRAAAEPPRSQTLFI